MPLKKGSRAFTTPECVVTPLKVLTRLSVSPAPSNEAFCGVYGLHLGDRRYRYVGLTTQYIDKRLAQHVRCAVLGVNTPVYSWMRKYGPLTIQIELLEQCSRGDLPEREKHWISELRNQGFDLLNLSAGGDGALGVVRSEETRRKMSEAQKGIPKSETHRKNLWKNRERSVSGQTRRKLSEAGKGNTNASPAPDTSYLTPEYREMLSTARRGKPNVGSHIRWHVNKGVSKPETCKFCKEEANAPRHPVG